jgi:colicin import membrane protein
LSSIGDLALRILMPEWAPPAVSLGLHAVILAMLTVSLTLQSDASRLAQSGLQAREVIQATVIDAGAIEAEMARQAELERQQRAAAAAMQQREQAVIDQTRQERRDEEARLAELERQRQVSQQQAVIDAQAQRQRQADAAAQAVAEQRRLDELRQQQEDEAARLAALRVEQAVAEQRRQQAEAEALLQQQMAQESRRDQAVSAGLLDQYRATVSQAIKRAWNYPGAIAEDFRCVVVINQIPGGDVVSVEFGECNTDEIWRRSLETAVLRASPLPGPPPEALELFDRRLRIVFTP